jgi:predicted aconitase with swiveling domain
MPRSFKGRVILPGDVEGEALVTHQGFNSYAVFYDSLHDQATMALSADSGNRELYGKNLAGKIICLPKTIGSTSAGAVWQRVLSLGIAPRAMLFSESIDSLAAGGLLVADIWTGRRIITVDQLGSEFLECVEEGDLLGVIQDGTVILC